VFRLTLEYDGSGFSGWQRQPGVRTVEGVLRDALAALRVDVLDLSAAGRTDAGAHAHGQVVGLTLSDQVPADPAERSQLSPERRGASPERRGASSERRGPSPERREPSERPQRILSPEHPQRILSPERLRGALNAVLPPDVTVAAVAAAPDGFHARKDALTRTYRYLVVPRGMRMSVARQYAWQVRGPLDLAAMRRAARLLEGTHDFAAFGRSPRPGGTTTRTVHSARVRRVGRAILIDVSADAFLYGMMRSFAGALVAVGEGRMTVAQLHALITTPPQQRANITVAPAHGLHQWAVTYPENR
jgi:tRNA pseudouridine38-40 synthase